MGKDGTRSSTEIAVNMLDKTRRNTNVPRVKRVKHRKIGGNVTERNTNIPKSRT